jgi:alcohol dehydrogenase
LDDLPEELVRLGAERALVVPARALVAERDLRARVDRLLGPRLGGWFTGVVPHTPYAAVLEGADLARGLGVDSVVSIGGGAAIDTARLISFCLAGKIGEASELRRFRARLDEQGVPVFPALDAPALPHVAVPTTLSAAEFSNGAAVTWPDPAVKDLVVADSLAARSVLLDSDLAVRTPARAWVTTGMRALDHAIETACSPQDQPPAEELARAAIRRLATSLPATIADPADTSARAEAQIAGWMSYAGVASGTLGLSHAIGHQLGAELGLEHGRTSCIVLPTVMRFLEPSAAGKLASVAAAMGEGSHAERAAPAVERLVERLGLDGRLPAPLADPERTAQAVLADVLSAGVVPRPRLDELTAILAGLPTRQRGVGGKISMLSKD